MNRHVVMLGAALAVLLAACGAPASGLLPPPSSTSSTSTAPPTVPVDHSRLALEGFPGQVTTTVPIESGRSTIRGRVLGPEGNVPGALVRVDRLVGDTLQRRDLPTDPEGVFVLANVPGGRYRLRAFLAPSLAMMDSEIFFLEDGGTKEIDLRTEVFEGLAVKGSTNPANPIVGQGVNLAIRVAQRSVDGEGVGREVPLAGVPVRVSTSGFTVLDRPSEPDPDDDSDDPQEPSARVTDVNGVIVFQFACDRVGSTTATAVVGSDETEETFSIEVPPCSPVPTTTTTAPPAEDESGDTTTTTSP